MAAATFGHQWAGKVVQFVVDNEAVVEVIRATYSKDLHLMHLIRLLVLLVYSNPHSRETQYSSRCSF